MPRLLLLPGLNGSSSLFAPLLEHLDPKLGAQALCLPADCDQDYETLADRLTGDLGETPFVLLGESFSGPLAYRLALRKPPGLSGVIFAASFLRRPHPLLSIQRYLPLPRNILTRDWAIHMFCLGDHANPALIELLRNEIQATSTPLLRARLQSLSELREPEPRLDMPALQLLPRYDRLVDRNAQDSVIRCCSHLRQITIDGPHFLLQSRPQACARAIEQFMAELHAGL
ncbi:alpha/beta fold hydrolase [Pseudomonas borbori]